MKAKLVNLHSDNFLYNDLQEFIGKIKPIYQLLGTRYNDEIYFYLSRGILNPNILEIIPNR